MCRRSRYAVFDVNIGIILLCESTRLLWHLSSIVVCAEQEQKFRASYKTKIWEGKNIPK